MQKKNKKHLHVSDRDIFVKNFYARLINNYYCPTKINAGELLSMKLMTCILKYNCPRQIHLCFSLLWPIYYWNSIVTTSYINIYIHYKYDTQLLRLSLMSGQVYNKC